MKFSVDRQHLAEVVGWAARSLPHRPAIPAVGGILFEADGDGLHVAVFDYDVSARATAEPMLVQIAEPGRALIPGRVLAEIVKALPGKPRGKDEMPVDMAFSDRDVTIRCGGAEFVLLTMPVGDFPKLPALPELVGTIDSALLRRAVDQVAPGAGTDTSLPMLTCVRTEIDGDQITFVTTDRYRMPVRKVDFTAATPGLSLAATIPAKTLTGITHGLSAGQVSLHLNEHLVAFVCDGRTTTVRLLDPDFPKWTAFFDRLDASIWATFDVAPLVAAVKRVALLAERSTPVRLSFTGDGVLVEAGGGDLGRASEVVDAELDGQDIQIAFQPHYFLDALGAVEGKRARLGMQAPTKPAVVTEDDDDSAFRSMAMPIRLSP